MHEILHIINEMSPYLLLGFLLAGLMHTFIPGRYYTRYLSRPGLRSVINAALFGIPLPLCSCGVIPTAMSLRREGASRGAVTSFLIATPQTGVDSIIATFGLMGLPFAVIRPIAALVTSVFGGTMVNAFGEKEDACGVDGGCKCAEGDERPKTVAGKLKGAIAYGYYTMMQDIGKWLVTGLVVAGLITVFVPEEYFALFKGNTFASMILVLCIAVPMYVCATGSIPIAIALMIKGLTPGAALVLLMAGPACNMASMLVVRKVLGTRTLLVYLLSITVGAISFGSLIDFLQYNDFVNFTGELVSQKACCMHPDSWFSWGCTVLLALLLFNALVIARFRKPTENVSEAEAANIKVYHIGGMSCNHCRASVEKAISGVEGVTSASVDLQKEEARVEGTASFDDIRKAVEEIGFECNETV